MNLLQIRASDPEISTWVSASAGTGKTKILTDRVLRLLLNNVKFEKILCLTFTNAAASEMKERILTSLSNWSNMTSKELYVELERTIGSKPSLSYVETAKKLYNLYLRSEEKINIQTIHSFCQKLLKKFPLESGVSPGFKIIDEYKSYSILQKIKKKLLVTEDLSLINEYLVKNFHETVIDEILTEIIQQKTKFLGKNHELENIYDESSKVIAKLNQNYDHYYKSIKQISIVENIVGYDINTKELKRFFLTSTGQKKKRIVTKKIADPNSSLYKDLETIQEEIYKLDQAEKESQLKAHSQILSILGGSIIENYENYKSSKGLLDYDDLIIYSNKLLDSSDAKDWILYKLDGGIDHLLVDEAQDTSIPQWKIIQSIIHEFYANSAENDEKNRTIFVVGDEKQSIFSFQGADVSSFAKMNDFLKTNMTASGKKFENINLETSYRSSKEIIDVVEHLFKKVSDKIPGMFRKSSLAKLQSFRSSHGGMVELWPLVNVTMKENVFWPISEDNQDKESSKLELAKKISSYIKKQISSERILPSTGKKITAGDFMILFRRRDDFTEEVIKSLKEDEVDVAGIDRILLKNNLAILDLLSVAKFIINVEDNLNLATLLKSPLIGISQEQLNNIATSRKENSIWDYIIDESKKDAFFKKIYDKLIKFLELYKICNISNFFHYIVDILGYREALNNFSKSENNDIIDEFLYICSNFSSEIDSSIANFIFWFESYDGSIKRENSSSEKVKIMTMHGSKGLQAPIVILCDTTTIPTNADRFITDKNGNNLSSKDASSSPEYYNKIKEKKKQEAYEEYLRLLYVGMTRAEDRLIVCGYKNSNDIAENCFYNLVKSSMLELCPNQTSDHLFYGKEEYMHNENSSEPNSEIEYEEFLDLSSNFQIETQEEKKTFLPTASPLSQKDPIGYGLVFHKILEDSLNAKDLNLMKSHPLIKTLDPKLQKRMHISMDKILLNKEFQKLSTKEIKTELSVGISVESEIKINRIDLVVIDSQDVIIIDYKSDKIPPSSHDKVPENYLRQLFAYKNAISKIYPDKNIRMMLLWLENGKLVEL